MNKYSGSNFDDFLEEEGILEEVTALARERLEKPDNAYGFIGRFLQSIQFNSQFVLRTISVCVVIAIGIYLGNLYFVSVTETQLSKLTPVSPTKVEPTLVKGQGKEVGISPFGFGAFPKIPTDFPDQDVWNVVEKQSAQDPKGAKTLELLARVRIELWNQGKHTKGVIMDPSNGLIYSDSDVEILFPKSPDLPKYDAYFDEDFVPSEGIVVIFLKGGVDPYEFLNLPR